VDTPGIRVLVVEDNPGDARLIREALSEVAAPRLSLHVAECLNDALQRLETNSYDAVLSDLSLPDAQGLVAVSRIQSQVPQVPVIVLTGLDSQDLALDAVRRGAQDYLVKGQMDGDRLARSIRYAIERKQIQEALTGARDELEGRVEDLTEANIQLQSEVNERRRAETQLLRRNRELLSLQSAIAATAASLDLQFVLDTVTWEMTNLLEVESCAIFEWEPQSNTILRLAHYPPPDSGPGEAPAETHDLADDPLRQRVLIERITEQISLGREARREALLIIPMVFQDRVVGLLEMMTSDTERVFTDHEISLGYLLANQAASAVENAKLFEQAQREIARRKEAEGRIKASLEEKEALLKEIHHRVKNNLQVVSSLLYLQSEHVSDAKVLGMLKDSQNRIRTMALVHERLYQTEDLARIDFPEYIRDLVDYLVSSYSIDAQAVSLRVDADDVVLDADTAVPCGLIVSELVSNSLKHAFSTRSWAMPDSASVAVLGAQGSWTGTSNGNENEIFVELRAEDDGRLRLLVGDNGVGFPEGMDWRSTQSLGLLLVNSLVRQIRGELEQVCHGGTQFEITFRAPRLGRRRGPTATEDAVSKKVTHGNQYP
jgi:two-component sensor histidine kinase/CheY-like chemotaxis protein